MTAKDFAVIASVIRQLENVQEQQYPRGSEGLQAIPPFCTAAFVAQLFEERLSGDHPRFDASKFEAEALPIDSARKRDAILKSLNLS